MDKGLLAEIEANPEDDAPRLVLADELQRKGDPRGEFIAVQCELARRGALPWRLFQDWIGDGLADGDVRALRNREKALLRKHGKEWTAAAAPFGVKDGDIRMRRGFIEALRWDNARHLSHGIAQLLKVAPLVRAVDFGTQHRGGSLTKLFRRKEWAQIRELYAPQEAALAAAPMRLTRLALSHDGGAHELRTIAATTWYARLESLTLTGFGVDAGDMEALLAPSPPLTELQLISSRCGRAGAEVIAASPVSRRLEILSLRYAKLAAGDVASIFTAKRWARLAALDLRTNELDADDLAALEKLPELRVLKVDDGARRKPRTG